MSLENWRANGWVTPHQATRREIADLLSVIDRDLKSSAAEGLDADWAMSIAYNAALQIAAAALAASGYKPARESHHYRLLQSLAETLGIDATTIAVLESFRKKRNLSNYERSGQTSEAEAGRMRAMASDLRQRVLGWLKANHPNLV